MKILALIIMSASVVYVALRVNDWLERRRELRRHLRDSWGSTEEEIRETFLGSREDYPESRMVIQDGGEERRLDLFTEVQAMSERGETAPRSMLDEMAKIGARKSYHSLKAYVLKRIAINAADGCGYIMLKFSEFTGSYDRCLSAQARTLLWSLIDQGLHVQFSQGGTDGAMFVIIAW